MRKFNHNKHKKHSTHHSGQRPQHRFQNNRPARRPEPVDEIERAFLASTAVNPSPRIRLEDGSSELTMRVMDLICPIGMGQRGLIVAPPGSGKTTFLKHICQAIAKANPKIKLYVLLIDERPEEVTDFRRSVDAEVRWSCIDETYEHHILTASTLMKDVYKEAHAGADVVVIIDSLTRLARVHNADMRTSGRTLSGGVDAGALAIPRRIFGSARRVENGGSLTILASILIDTGSRMDQVIFEEFKGTGNMEIVLSREISNKRVYPAVDISKSGTRKEESLLDETELDRVRLIRRALSELGTVEAAETLIKQLQKFPTNKEMLAKLII
jgi:transcription termination factor Rho